MSRLEAIRVAHGHRAVADLTKDRINSFILGPLADRPGAALDTLRKLRILIKHAIDKGLLKYDPSIGIKRPKGKQIRAWTDAELAAFERANRNEAAHRLCPDVEYGDRSRRQPFADVGPSGH